MGNMVVKRTCTDVRIRLDGSGGESKMELKVVTVMKWDGTVMEFARELTVCKLLTDFPGHFVCKAEELGAVDKVRKLCPKTRLKLCKTYYVIPRAQHQKQKLKAGTKSSKVNPEASSFRTDSKPQKAIEGGEEECPPERIRILMTKKQLAKMIADGSLLIIAGSKAAQDLTNMSAKLKTAESWYSSMRLFNHPKAVETISATPAQKWFPRLDSIVELPSQ